jgi:hypothetical protein
MTSTAICLVGLTVASAGEVHTDYYDAYREAQDGGRMLLIDFGTGFDFEHIDQAKLSRYVLCRISANTEVEVDGEHRRLLDLPAYAHLDGGPGLAVIDLTDEKRRTFGRPVSLLPHRHVTPHKVGTMLDLPRGTLTQRTLLWAFRIRPERPRGLFGRPCPRLMAHAARHSRVQCRANHQHHAASYPGSSEIVAESWPWNRNVADAAIDIVWSWSQSPGHWGAASRAWSHFGCDMKTNGQKWYETGVFR